MKITETPSVILCSFQKLAKSCEAFLTKYAVQPLNTLFSKKSKSETKPESSEMPAPIAKPADTVEYAESDNQRYQKLQTPHAPLLETETMKVTNDTRATYEDASYENNCHLQDEESINVDSVEVLIESQNDAYLSNKSVPERSSSVTTDAIATTKLSASHSNCSLNEMDPIDPILIEQSLMKILYKGVRPFDTDEQCVAKNNNEPAPKSNNALKDKSATNTMKNILTDHKNMDTKYRNSEKSNIDYKRLKSCQDKYAVHNSPFDDMNFEIDAQYDTENKNVFLAIPEPQYTLPSKIHFEDQTNEQQYLYEDDFGMFEINPLSSTSDMENDLTSGSEQLWTVKAESMFLDDGNCDIEETIESTTVEVARESPCKEAHSESLHTGLGHGTTKSDVLNQSTDVIIPGLVNSGISAEEYPLSTPSLKMMDAGLNRKAIYLFPVTLCNFFKKIL
ncbi:hypothetical protein SOMG_02262 [Schizosaccharomyces osmophilus]|uniref:Uncharacterized protein n=1 Tax=Schizosaccharomyces osmophilus TaxID=2545709 RepID=A0AAE9WCE6_9SCHI|nr:uncharacterized protein SOMG_02262 [Schizosaccharomyces osmophilus]WBW72128.1 hypothetical protein SOMG_02262 [Schizosaccharomyces osmophilus]